MFVIDASAMGALILHDGRSPPDAIAELLANTPLVAPGHWPAEVANLVLIAERRHRIDVRDRDFLFEQVRAMRVAVRHDGERTIWERAMTLAAEHRLTIYGAIYLEMAIRLNIALVTLDRVLLAAARARAVAFVTWTSS